MGYLISLYCFHGFQMHISYYFGTISVAERIGLCVRSVLEVYDEIFSTENLP